MDAKHTATEREAVRDRLIAEFTEGYMDKLFYFCLRKTGDADSAEDMTQDVMLHILTALEKGVVPREPSAWFWQIARNRYAAWADRRHRQREVTVDGDIRDMEIPDGARDPEEELIHAEQLSLMRRELSFIRSDYREVLVAYYIENESVRTIASRLSLSPNAVQQRLHRARITLKEGMDMAREFGKRSYRPEEVSFVMNGSMGKKGQPWSIVNHLLYKNIFLEVSEETETAEELALAVGVALPYMEDELNFLINEGLLRREGNGYRTNFPILSSEEQAERHKACLAIQKLLTEKMCALFDLYMQAGGAKVHVEPIGYEHAKWALLPHLFDHMKQRAVVGNGDEEDYPFRPDGGRWTLTGYQEIDWEEPFFIGQHGYTNIGQFPRSIEEVEFAQYKYQYRDMRERTPEFLNEKEACALRAVCVGQPMDAYEREIDKLLQYGYIRRTDDGKLAPALLLLDHNAEESYSAETAASLTALREEIVRLICKAPHITRGYVAEQALKDGWLRYDEHTPVAAGAYIYLS